MPVIKISIVIKAALHIIVATVLLATLAWHVGVQAKASRCETPRFDEIVTVRQAIDGDTLRLSDNRLLRLIGVNTPEIDHQNNIAEPLGFESRAWLRQWLQQNQYRIGVVYGAEAKDRHGRLLAHIYTLDAAASTVNAQQALLQQGLAFWIVVPPNLKHMDCYRDAEQYAQQRGIGVWGEGFYEPKNVDDWHALKTGFQLIKGKVVRVGHSKKSLWLNFNDHVAFRIDNDDLHRFDTAGLAHMEGRQVVARGWIYARKDKLVMRIKHPSAIQLLP
ncbi:thermonuclease family protein [Kaarinaea lacus]